MTARPVAPRSRRSLSVLLVCAGLLGCGGPTVPSGSAACELWAERKAGACQGALLDSPSPSADEPQTRLGALTLYEQCHLFEARRAAVAECAGIRSCSGFAECTVALTRDGWEVPTTTEVCDAMERRRAGPSNDAVQALLRERPMGVRRDLMLKVYGLHGRCVADEAVRKQVAACVDQLPDRFAACLLELAEAG